MQQTTYNLTDTLQLVFKLGSKGYWAELKQGEDSCMVPLLLTELEIEEAMRRIKPVDFSGYPIQSAGLIVAGCFRTVIGSHL